MANIKANEGTTSQNLHGQHAKGQSTKIQLQHELQSVNQQLRTMSKARKSSEELEVEHHFLDRSIIIQLKLKRWKEVVDDGYKILGKKGPSAIVYKCILVGLCRLGRYDDEVSDLLDVWRKATPKCGQMIQCKEKMNYYLNAIKSGLEPSELFKNLEDALGLNADWIVKDEENATFIEKEQQIENNISNTKIVEKYIWKFRPPPSRSSSYYLCPRGGNACIYGDKCFAAHSKEELEEWIQRKQPSGVNNNYKYIEEKQQKIPLRTKQMDKHSKLLLELPSAVNLLKELPSFAFHYLVEIHKRIKETMDIRKLFAEDLHNVKLLCKSPLKILKTVPVADLGITSIENTWVFVISTKSPMRNVCLLEDCHRECFRISSGKFLDASKTSVNLIELHDMNALQDSKSGVQVLNTFIPLPILYQIAGNWPDWFFYKIEVTFRQPPLKYGTFLQSLMFDMKYDPKLIKHLTIEVVPEEYKKINNVTSHQENNAYNETMDYQLNASGRSDPYEMGFVESVAMPKLNLFSDENCNSDAQTNGYSTSLYENLPNTVPIQSTSKINGFNSQMRVTNMHAPTVANYNKLEKQSTENDNAAKLNISDNNGEPEKNYGLWSTPTELNVVKQSFPFYNIPSENPNTKSSYNNIISQDLNPSKFLMNSTHHKLPESGNQKLNGFMTSLYEQNIPTDGNRGFNSLRGSTPSLRSESPSSTCTNSSSSSRDSDFPKSSKNSHKDTEWLKVQKSNKKIKYIPERHNLGPSEDSNPSGLSTETKIGFLQEMGFDRRSAIKALQFCNKDLERSVEWLISEDKRHGHNKQIK